MYGSWKVCELLKSEAPTSTMSAKILLSTTGTTVTHLIFWLESIKIHFNKGTELWVLQLLKLVPNNKHILITTVTILTIIPNFLSKIYKSTKKLTSSLLSTHILRYGGCWRGIEVSHERALIETHFGEWLKSLGSMHLLSVISSKECSTIFVRALPTRFEPTPTWELYTWEGSIAELG